MPTKTQWIPWDRWPSWVTTRTYYDPSFSFSMKSSFIMETKSISHILRQVSLEPFVTVMSVVRMTVRISVVDDFEVPLTTLYDYVDTQENHIGNQGNTDTDTDTHTHRHTVRWVLLNNPSCLMHRLHIVILHPLVALALEWRGKKNFILAGLFYLSYGQRKKGSRGRGGSLRKQGTGTETYGNSTCFPMFPK